MLTALTFAATVLGVVLWVFLVALPLLVGLLLWWLGWLVGLVVALWVLLRGARGLSLLALVGGCRWSAGPGLRVSTPTALFASPVLAKCAVGVVPRLSRVALVIQVRGWLLER